MTGKKLSKWCQSVLPAGFSQISDTTSRIQQFLVENLPEPLNTQVAVISVNDESIVISATDSQVANYLRLYTVEIQQQIQETFNLNQKLKVRTIPGSLLKVGERPSTKKPSKVLPQTAKTLDHNAEWIEDETLRQALKSLADSLRQRND